MSDQNTAAIQALIQQMTTIGERLDGLAKHNERLLDQVIATKKDTPKDEPEKVNWTEFDVDGFLDRVRQQNGLSKSDGLENFRREGAPVRISKADALDPAQYDQAKRAAAEAGVQLEIFDEETEAPAPAQPDNLYQPVKPVQIRRADAIDPVKYGQAKKQAEAAGVALEIVNDTDE